MGDRQINRQISAVRPAGRTAENIEISSKKIHFGLNKYIAIPGLKAPAAIDYCLICTSARYSRNESMGFHLVLTNPQSQHSEEEWNTRNKRV